MLTNFHLPQSALMMQVAAFAGIDELKKAYKEAIKEVQLPYLWGCYAYYINETSSFNCSWWQWK